MFPKLFAAVLVIVTMVYALYFAYELYLHPFDVLKPMLYIIPIALLWVVLLIIA